MVEINNVLVPKEAITRQDVDGVNYKYIANTDELFVVSRLGEVYSLTNKMRGKRIGSKVPIGYMTACIKYTDGTKKIMYIHRLVADAFIPNDGGKKQVVHINEQRDDNRVENLRWSVAKENCTTDSHIMKLSASVKAFYKKRDSFGKKAKRIVIIDEDGNTVEISPSIQKAADYIAEKKNKSQNSTSVQITGILQGRNGFKTVGGYTVRQATEEEYRQWVMEHMNQILEDDEVELSVEQVKKLNKVEGVMVINRRLNIATGDVITDVQEYEKGEKIENDLH